MLQPIQIIDLTAWEEPDLRLAIRVSEVFQGSKLSMRAFHYLREREFAFELILPRTNKDILNHFSDDDLKILDNWLDSIGLQRDTPVDPRIGISTEEELRNVRNVLSTHSDIAMKKYYAGDLVVLTNENIVRAFKSLSRRTDTTDVTSPITLLLEKIDDPRAVKMIKTVLGLHFPRQGEIRPIDYRAG